MERTEHTQIIQNLLSLVAEENQATASEQLTQLSEDYETTLNTIAELETSNGQLKDNNEKLRKANTELFLKVGEKVPTQKQTQNTNGYEENPIDYSSLFNDKGELK